MSRTVVVREIKKVKETEISKFKEFTRREICENFEKIFSLTESEYFSDTYAATREMLTRISTIGGHILYVAHTKILANCSSELLAKCIREELQQNYVVGEYCDITMLAGKKISASEVKFKKGDKPEDVETVEKNMEFSIPNIAKGTRIFFFDDMG